MSSNILNDKSQSQSQSHLKHRKQDNRPIVFYDGHCGICSFTVSMLLKIDRHRRLCFAPLNSKLFAEISKNLYSGKNQKNIDSIHLCFRQNKGKKACLVKSAAILFILKQLPQPWKSLAIIAIIPQPLLDWLYDVIARLRRKIFKIDAPCDLP